MTEAHTVRLSPLMCLCVRLSSRIDIKRVVYEDHKPYDIKPSNQLNHKSQSQPQQPVLIAPMNHVSLNLFAGKHLFTELDIHVELCVDECLKVKITGRV